MILPIQNFDSCSIKLLVKKTKENAKMPERGSDKAAGYDLSAAIDESIEIAPGDTVKINTGLAIELPDDTFGAIVARSGLATKRGLAPANKIGIIDSDYRGDVIVALHNHSNEHQIINPGDRIAQLIVIPFYPIQFEEVEELEDTERNSGGFGSTGVN